MQSESRYHYLNDVNYFFKYSEDVVANITNVIIPYVSQFEYYSDENHFNRIIQILLESDHTYEDIYYSLGVYLLSQTDDVEEKMNTVRTILYNLQRADEAVAQRVLNIMNVLIPPADAGDAVSQQELQQMQDFKRIVPDEELAKLQVVAFSELQTDEKSCSICLDEFVPESQLYTIPCKHLFHTDCLKDWVAENYKCPVCRCEIAKYKVDLEDEETKGKTIITTNGVNMVGESNTIDFSDINLFEIKKGVYDQRFSKKICFKYPDVNMEYWWGAHKATAHGNVSYSNKTYLLKHYNYLGEQYLIEKYRKRYERNQKSREMGMNGHYLNDIEEVKKLYKDWLSRAITID